MASDTLVLVTGATGQQGGAVARALLSEGFRVRGVTRNTESEGARALAAAGAEMVSASFTDPAALDAAMEGVDSVFGMSTPFEGGVDAETEQGKALVDAAKRAGVGHFVYSSVAGADQGTGIPHFDSKYRVEEHLAESGLRWTVVGPVYFMGNLFFPDALEALKNGAFAIAMPADVSLQQIAVEDIGAFAAHVIAHPDDFDGQRIDIAGDDLSAGEAAAQLSDVLGRDIGAVEIPIEAIRAWSDDLAIMYEWFVEHGYESDVNELRARYPDVSWTRFRDWAERVRPALP